MVSPKVDISGSISFNDQELSNDLEGRGNSSPTLEGSVMFAQTQIIPSKSPTDATDIRPHLVSLRDTLVLFKPLSSNFDISSGVNVNVYDKSNNKIYGKRQMMPPDKLPRIAESGDGDIYDFLESHMYDHVISTKDEINLVNNGADGTYLEGIFSTHKSLKMELSNDKWIENILLPEMADTTDMVRLVFFVSNAPNSCYVTFDGNRVELKKGSKLAFTNVHGKWNDIYNSFYSDTNAIKSLIADKSYSKIVSSHAELSTLGSDTKGQRLHELLRDNDNIKIVTANGRWTENFYLPKNSTENDGKTVTFTSSAGYNSFIVYDLGSLKLSKGNILTFVNRNGKWMELSDAFYSSIKYGNNFWSLFLPFEIVQPGISISFSNNENIGLLKNVRVGAPNELLIHTIDLGMLVEPRDQFTFQKDHKYHAEYFQQVPVSRLIVNEYEPITFNEIVIPDGTTYNVASSDEGGIFTGDMRQYIGKILISLGINHANYGIHSGVATRERTPFTCGQVTAHNARGRYSNGVQEHGLSGGNSMITLSSSIGNEFSHELGHNWLGHYPNGFDGSVHRSSEAKGSTWGWDSVRNIFLPNFEKSITGKSTCLNDVCQEPFLGHQFGLDAMAGGAPLHPLTNAFTLYTPYSLSKIQSGYLNGLESKAVFDKNSETGMSIWNSECECMEPWKSPGNPKDVNQDYPREPLSQGVPVATLLGYYDPQLELRSFIFPALHAAYGNTFGGIAAEDIDESKCFATITNSQGGNLIHELKASRETWNRMNMFHINVEEAFNPKSISISCKGEKVAERSITGPSKKLSYTINGQGL